MNFQFAYPWAVSLLAALVYGALLVFLVLRHRWSGKIERRFALYLVLLLLVNLANAGSYGQWAYAEIREFILKLQLYTQAATPLFFYLFLRAFIRQEDESRTWLPGVMLLAALLFVDLANISLDTVFGFVSEATIVLFLRKFLFAAFTTFAILFALREFRQTTSPLHRNRLAYLPLALPFFVVDFALGLILDDPARPLAVSLQLIGVLILGYATLRHKLADLRNLLRQGISYLILTLFTFVVYTVILEGRSTLERVGGGVIGVLAASLVLALIYQPLRDRIPGWIDGALLGQPYNVQAVVQEFSQRLIGLTDLDQFVVEGRALLRKTFGARDAALVLVNRESTFYALRPVPRSAELPNAIQIDVSSPFITELMNRTGPLLQYDIDRHRRFADLPAETRAALSKLDGEVYVPILRDGALIGIWVIGAKISGQPYSADDLKLLLTLGDQSAVALEYARLLAETKDERRNVRSMRDYLDTTLANLASGIITLDREGNILSVNPAAEEIFRITSTNAIGKNHSQILPPLEGAQLPWLVSRIWTNRSEHIVRDAVAEIPGRGQVHLAVHLSPMRHENEIVAIALVIEDLTEQVRVEEERAQKLEQVETVGR